MAFAPISMQPYADLKVVLVAAGTTLIVVGSTRVDRTLAIWAAVWVGALSITTVLSVDPWWSLMGAENQNVGALLLGCSALCMVGATSMPHALLDRIPRWLFISGIVAALMTMADRALGFTDMAQVGSWGPPLGQPVLFGGFLALALVAGLSLGSNPWVPVGAFVIGGGLTTTANRTGWIALMAGVAAWVTVRGRWKGVAVIVLPVLAAAVVLTAVDRVSEPPAPVSSVGRFAQVEEGSSARARPYVWSVYAKSWFERPIFGSGPATGWGGFVANATPTDFRQTQGRGWGDAHNVFMEVAATMGIVGLMALLGWLLTWATRARRGSWAVAAFTALAVTHLLQPLSVALTPLFFLMAGASTEPKRTVRMPRLPVTTLLAVLLTLSLLRLGASSAERIGRSYDLRSALRVSVSMEPWRIGPVASLAIDDALRARSGDAAAARSARFRIARLVRHHSWHPGVRLTAADVEVLLGDDVRAATWLDRHLALFPNDPEALRGAAILARRRGYPVRADLLAHRAAAAGAPLPQQTDSPPLGEGDP